jgi:hypothetical protein
LIAAYGLDPATAWMVPPADPAEAVRYPVSYEEGQVIRAGRHGDWAFVIDDLLLENTLGMHFFDVTAHLPEGTEGALVKWTEPEGRMVYWGADGDPVEFDPEADDPADFLERAGADPGLASEVDFEDLDDPTPVHIQFLDLLTLATRVRGTPGQWGR